MSLTTDGMTPADLAAVTGGNNGMFGSEGGAWWIIILFLFIFSGWGNGFGNNASGAADNYVLASDFAQIERQLDSSTDRLAQQGNSIANGLCDGFYAQNTTMLNGFAGVNQNMSTGFANAELSRANQQAALMNQLYTMGMNDSTNANATQRAIENGFAQAGYNTATSTCSINTNVSNAARDIVDSQTANTRAILDAINAQSIEAKNEKIAEQNQTIFGLQLAASQQAQNNYLVSQLKQCPIPAYTVPNPYGTGCSCSG